VLGKAGKAISLSTAQSAQLQAENQRLKYQLEQLQSRQTRKRVRVDQNKRFNNAESIKAAIDRAAAQAAQSSTKETEKAAKAAAAQAAALSLASICTQFQI
jgi:cell shape-determining protein MreC